MFLQYCETPLHPNLSSVPPRLLIPLMEKPRYTRLVSELPSLHLTITFPYLTVSSPNSIQFLMIFLPYTTPTSRVPLYHRVVLLHQRQSHDLRPVSYIELSIIPRWDVMTFSLPVLHPFVWCIDINTCTICTVKSFDGIFYVYETTVQGFKTKYPTRTLSTHISNLSLYTLSTSGVGLDL